MVLIQRCDESHSQPRVLLSGSLGEFLVFSISFRTYLFPLELDPGITSGGYTFPLGPHFRDYLLAQVIRGCQSQARLSRNMAQHRTNNLRPTATMAIFLRAFLPPLSRWYVCRSQPL